MCSLDVIIEDFQVFSVAKMPIVVSWVVSPYEIAGRYQRFGRTNFFYRQVCRLGPNNPEYHVEHGLKIIYIRKIFSRLASLSNSNIREINFKFNSIVYSENIRFKIK
jgi:hypothetical protein